METCTGCGSPLTPTWKYCVHCGLEVERPEVPAAIRPEQVAAHDHHRRNRALLLGGIGIFCVGIALLIVAGAYFIGEMH